MPTPAELRESALLFKRAAESETSQLLKRMLTSHAHALAQLAEKIERKEGAARADRI